MHEVEQFFFNWKYTSVAFFSAFGFILAIWKIGAMIAKAHCSIVLNAVEQALIDQRQNYQAEAIDKLLEVIDEQQNDIRRYSKAKEDDAINSAKVALILETKKSPD